MSQALFVVDMINDIVNPKGAIAFCAKYCEESPVVENINKLIKYFRQQQLPIFFIRVGFKEDYSDCPRDWAPLKEKPGLKTGSWGTEVIDEIDFDSNSDQLITKTRVSPFYKTDLESELRKREVTELIITGVATNNAVDLCAREAWDRNLSPTVIVDACGAATKELHEATSLALPPVIIQKRTQEFLDFV